MMDSYYSIDPAGDANTKENQRELYCKVCDTESTQWVEEEYKYGVVYWNAQWTCPNCKTEFDDEGEFEVDSWEG